MKTLQNKKSELSETITDFKNENKNLNDLIAVHYPEYNIKTNVNFDDIRINIQHSTYQWTEFVSCIINKDGIDFSHGSGGWNDIDSKTKLKITKEIFDIVQFIMNIENTLWTKTKEIFKIDYKLTKLRREIISDEKEIIQKEASEQMLKDGYEIALKENVLNTIKNGGRVILYLIDINHLNEWMSREITLVNKGNNRLNYYYNNQSLSKKETNQLFETYKYYTKKEV